MKKTFQQAFRFTLTGAINTAVAYGVFALLLLAGFHYTLATLLGGMAGMVTGFKLTGAFVFRIGTGRGWLRFMTVFGIMYAFNISLQAFLHAYMSKAVAGLVAAMPCLLISFLLNKFFVFRPDPRKSRDGADEAYARWQIARSHHWLRRQVRRYYLRDLLRHVDGPAIDFGCGSGDLLAMLPPGSIGLEINPFAVEHCRSRGLDAQIYDPGSDHYRLSSLPGGHFKAMILAHVLEHMEDPGDSLHAMLHAAARLGIRRVILAQPCQKGFRSDPTHKVYVDHAYLAGQGLLDSQGFKPTRTWHFPFKASWMGHLFTYQEYRIVLQREEYESAIPLEPEP